MTNHGGDEDSSLPPIEAMDLPPEDAPVQPQEFYGAPGEEPAPLDEIPAEAAPGGDMPVPEEGGTDPSQSVESMLSAELLPDMGFAPEASPALPEQPSFQLQFRNLRDEQRPAMKKALEAAGVPVEEKTWAAGTPVISQLTEYQAVLLLQHARILGAAADAGVVMPNASPSEEDLALGDLSQIPEPFPMSVETAPSVTLPKGEKDVLLCTPDRLPGGTVRESFGIIMAHRSIPRRLFRDEELRDKLQKELRSVPAGSPAPTLASSHLQILLRELMLDLRKLALSKGANSVLGVKIEAFPESGIDDPELEQLRLVAFGTAAVVEKS